MQMIKSQSNKWAAYLLFICLSLLAYELIVNVKYFSQLNVYVFLLAEVFIICMLVVIMAPKRKKIKSIGHIL